MSASRQKQKKSRSSKQSSNSSQLPTGWSEWDWDTNGARWRRYRLDAAEEYEFQYETPANEKENGAASSTPGSHVFGTSAESSTVTTSAGQFDTSELHDGRGIDPLPQFSLLSVHPALMNPTHITHIRTKNPKTDQEEFNPRYKVHQSWEFKWGMVFKVLWVEPKGSTEDGTGDSDSDASYTGNERQNADGQIEFQKVRRFVIIKPMQGCCICLPINTYSRQGVTKKGIIAEDHTIIYSEKKAIHRHKLDERSRLNYAKHYTVEYNVKVCLIGKVDKTSEWQLNADYNAMHPPLTEPPIPRYGQYGEVSDASEDMNNYSMPGDSSSVTDSGSVTDYSLPKALQVLDKIQEDASKDISGTANDHVLASSLEDNDDSEDDLPAPSFTDSRATWTTPSSESTVLPTRATSPEPRATFFNPEVGSPAVPLPLAAVEETILSTNNPLLPTQAQCRSLTDNQCRRIQDIVDPRGTRAHAYWGTPHQLDLIRLYMAMKSFLQIESDMKGKLDCSYKTYNNRFRDWLFPTTKVEREQKVIELYALLSNQDCLAPFPDISPRMARMELKTLESRGRSRFSSFSSQKSFNSTIADSIFSGSQFSEFSAASSLAASHYGGSDRLVTLLLGDTILHSLIGQIFHNFGPEKFVLELRSCLLKFSKHIILEAAPARSFNMMQAGKALRYLARRAAISIKEKLEDELSNILEPLSQDSKSLIENQLANHRGLTEGEVDMTASEKSGGDEIDMLSKGEEDHQGDEGDDEFLEQDMPPTLEDDLSKSSAYQLLRENLQLCVEPDNVRKSLFEI
ncbi:hypothetical protein IFR05_011600 [Cadophora sp. M221]|nr:hypothetical protein IFR05_011600 [Cadophora sp. M221]